MAAGVHGPSGDEAMCKLEPLAAFPFPCGAARDGDDGNDDEQFFVAPPVPEGVRVEG